MFQEVWAGISWALGLELDTNDINVWQMSLRALVVFVVAIAMVRLGNKRFMGKNTALDILLAVILGAVVSRAITGNAPFFPALAAGLVLVLVHWAFSAITFHSHRVGTLVKGHARTLVRDGELQWEEMQKAHISEHDLQEAMRSSGQSPDVREVESAHLERSGDISIIPREHRKPES